MMVTSREMSLSHGLRVRLTLYWLLETSVQKMVTRVTIQKGCIRKPGGQAGLTKSAARHERDPSLACEGWRDNCECGRAFPSLLACANCQKPFDGLSTAVHRVPPDWYQRAPRHREERPARRVCGRGPQCNSLRPADCLRERFLGGSPSLGGEGSGSG
jgi:hypothetical protein